MIDVEERPLRALEENALTGIGNVLENLRHVGSDRRDRFRGL